MTPLICMAFDTLPIKSLNHRQLVQPIFQYTNHFFVYWSMYRYCCGTILYNNVAHVLSLPDILPLINWFTCKTQMSVCKRTRIEYLFLGFFSFLLFGFLEWILSSNTREEGRHVLCIVGAVTCVLRSAVCAAHSWLYV